MKTSSSYANLTSSHEISAEVIQNLQKLLRSSNDFSSTTPSIVKSLLVVTDVKKEEKVDSGRESEDQVRELPTSMALWIECSMLGPKLHEPKA